MRRRGFADIKARSVQKPAGEMERVKGARAEGHRGALVVS